MLEYEPRDSGTQSRKTILLPYKKSQKQELKIGGNEKEETAV